MGFIVVLLIEIHDWERARGSSNERHRWARWYGSIIVMRREWMTLAFTSFLIVLRNFITIEWYRFFQAKYTSDADLVFGTTIEARQGDSGVDASLLR